MTATWLDLSYPLDPCLDRLLRDLDDQLQARNLPYLLTGAMAREILLHYGWSTVMVNLSFQTTGRDGNPGWSLAL